MARIREEQIAYWKGLVTPIWNWVALPFFLMPSDPVTSQHRNSIPIPPKVQQPENAGSVSTCVPHKANTFGLVHRRNTVKVGWMRSTGGGEDVSSGLSATFLKVTLAPIFDSCPLLPICCRHSHCQIFISYFSHLFVHTSILLRVEAWLGKT